MKRAITIGVICGAILGLADLTLGSGWPQPPPPRQNMTVPFRAGDATTFNPNDIDVTLPDGFVVERGAVVIKTWKITNAGTVYWQDRFLLRSDAPTQGFASELYTPIPNTAPQEPVEMSVQIVAPTITGQNKTTWKMVELLYWNGRRWVRISHRQYLALKNQNKLPLLVPYYNFPQKSGVYALGNVN